MLTCTNGHTFPKTDSDVTLVTECPTCGEKLSEIISPDNSGTLLDSHLVSPSENRAFVKPESIDNTLVPNSVDEEPNSNLLATQDLQGTFLDSQLLKPESIDNTLVPNSVDEEPNSKLLATQDLQGTFLDSQLLKPESIDNTLVSNSIDEEPNSKLLATQDLQGTFLDSQLLKPESISPTQSKPDAANNTKTVNVQKTEAINNPNDTLDMVPGIDTRIQKQPNFDGLTNKVVTDPSATFATLDMVPGIDTRIQKQPNFDIPTNALSNSDLEKPGFTKTRKL